MTITTTSQGLSSPPKPGSLLQPKSSLLSAAVFPHLLNSDSSKVIKPDPKLSQLRQQNSVLPALLRSLAPALTPVLLVLLSLICGSLVAAYKVCGARNRAPRSYICLSVFAQSWKRQSQDGMDIEEKQTTKKACVFKII